MKSWAGWCDVIERQRPWIAQRSLPQVRRGRDAREHRAARPVLHRERHRATVRAALAAQPQRQQGGVLLHLTQLKRHLIPRLRSLERIEQPDEVSSAQPVSSLSVDAQAELLVRRHKQQMPQRNELLDLLCEGL